MIENFGLYLVITNPATSYETCAEAAVRADLRYIQLRMKNTPRQQILKTANALRRITQGSATRLIINDDPDLAAEAQADGVHIGQDDGDLATIRASHPSLRFFGLSTHNPAQAKAAEAGVPDYIGVGPVFATPTKQIADPTVGIAAAGAIVRASPLTTVAIGGIDAANLPDVLRAGVINFAVVRHVCLAADPYAAIQQLQTIWRETGAAGVRA